MRNSEIKSLTWGQIDFDKRILDGWALEDEAGTGRTIPLNGTVLDALVEHARWYVTRFKETRPEWFVFPGGGRSPNDPTLQIRSLKTAWKKIRKKAGVSGRWHDGRHTSITELAESGAGDETSWRSPATFPARCSRGQPHSDRGQARGVGRRAMTPHPNA